MSLGTKTLKEKGTYFPVVCISIASTSFLFNSSAVLVGSRTYDIAPEMVSSKACSFYKIHKGVEVSD
jgi:hypothetical protein